MFISNLITVHSLKLEIGNEKFGMVPYYVISKSYLWIILMAYQVGANLVFALNPGNHKDCPYGILPNTPDRIFQWFKAFCTFHKYPG